MKAISILAACISFNALADTVTVYSAHGGEVNDPIFNAFRAKYPDIKVEVIATKSSELFQRVKAESSKPAADIAFGGSIQSYDVYVDLFQPSPNANTDSYIVSDEAHNWHPFSVFSQPIMVNTRLVSEDNWPKNVHELVNKDWSQFGGLGLVIADPNKSGTGYTIVGGLANGLGWDFTTDLIKKAHPVPGSSAMFQSIRDGEAAIGWINEDLGAKWQEAGLPVKLIYPTDALTVQVDGYGLIKGAPNKKSALKLIEFIGSEEGQTIAVEAVNRRSARYDVDPPAGLPALEDLPLFSAEEPRSLIKAKFVNIRSK